MKMEFHKYQGTGNDFIMVNNMENQVNLTIEQIRFLCDRKKGIGADGLILIEPDESSDFYVNYYNSDGTQSFCGNGSRCSVAFSKRINIFSGNQCSFNAIDGAHVGEVLDSGDVKVSMGDVLEIERLGEDAILNTGSPHYVQHCEELGDVDIVSLAHKVRYNDRFSDLGINVNFVEVLGESVSMRTYERGVEDETLSCGTGVTAVALSLAKNEGEHQTTIHTKGGELSVSFDFRSGEFRDIHLIGAVALVFQGFVNL